MLAAFDLVGDFVADEGGGIDDGEGGKGEVADAFGELMELFGMKVHDASDIIKQEFGEGVGFQTTAMFMDPVYGPAFNLREKTANKYRYLVAFLRKAKKEFAL